MTPSKRQRPAQWPGVMRELGSGAQANDTTDDSPAFAAAMTLAGKLGRLHDRRAVRRFAHLWFDEVERMLDAGV